MTPYFKKLGALIALFFAAMLLVPSVAQAAECGTPAVEAVYETITVPPIPPVTEEIKVIDVAYVPEIPGTPEIPAVPEIPEVSHIVVVTLFAEYDETVIDKEAYDEVVPDGWQRYSWTGGPHTEDDAPGFPSDDWQPNVKGDPHNVGVAGAYYRSNGNSGNGDWFYLEALTKTVHHEAETHIVHHEAVTEEQKVIDQEYVPGVPAVPAVPPVPAVEEVSHMETVIVEPGVPGHTRTVTVSEAVPAGPPCPVEEPPVVEEPPLVPVTETTPDPVPVTYTALAQTGSNELGWIAFWGAALTLAGLGAMIAGHQIKRNSM